MFQLIVAVISIALVAALAIASIYYGGPAFSNSSLKANVTTLVNGGQQISGADALYKTEVTGAGAGNIGNLVPDYLAAIPGISSAAEAAGDGTTWSIATVDETRIASVLVAAGAEAAVCEEAAKQAGTEWTNLETTVSEALFEGQFGCYETVADGPVAFGFKL